jgi:hypothetical protein
MARWAAVNSASYVAAKGLVGLVPAAYAGGLDHHPGLAHVTHLVVVEPAHLRPLVRHPVGQPLGHQQAQRLAHGGPGDAEGVGERDLAQRGARAELALEQRATELLDHPVDRRDGIEAEGGEGGRAGRVAHDLSIVRQFLAFSTPQAAH